MPPLRSRRRALLGAVAYLAGATLYVLLSDRAAAFLAGDDAALLSLLQSVKGVAFIVLTAVALFLLSWRLAVSSWRAAQAEAQAQAQRADRQTLFEHGPDAALVLEDERFVAANRAAEVLFRCPAVSLIGLSPWQLSPERQPDGRESEEAARRLISVAATGEVHRFFWRHRRADSTLFDAEVSLTVPPGSPRRVLAWVRDVTDQAQSRARLADANARLRLLVEGTPHFFFYRQEADGKVSYVSPSIAAITGRSPAQWIGQSHWFATAAAINEEARAASAANLRGEQAPNPIVLEIAHADGRPLLLEAYEYPVVRDGRPAGAQGIARDVTGQVRSQRIRDAIYRISEAANAATGLDELYAAIHSIVGELMPASNFYIALYDPDAELISFPYFVDEIDEVEPPRPLGRGITEYVLRTGRPFLSRLERFDELAATGDVEMVGSPSLDWLGVPLVTKERTIGVLAVQSYTEGVRYREEDQAILMFVSTQVAMAIERARAEQAMRESEERFRTLAETCPAGVLILDGEHIAYANPAAEVITGYARSEIEGQSLVMGVHPDDQKLVAERARRRREGGGEPAEYELRIVRKDGETRWVLANAGLIRLDSGHAIVATFFDITERKRTEQALKESEQRLRDIVEHSTNLFFAHDTEQILTYISPQSRQFLDCEPEEALVRWTEFVTDHPINRIGVERTARAISTGQRQPTYELELAGRKGRRIRVEVSEAPVVRDGRTIAVVGALTDITERRLAEEALRESEERYRRLVERSPDAIVVHADGRFVFANEAAARMMGFDSPQELLGRPVLDVMHPEDRAGAAARIARLLETGEPAPLVEERIVRPDGRVVHVEVMGIPLSYRGKPAVQLVARDVTTRRQLEEHLWQTQKMEAIGRLAGGVAHDFNNLLQALLSTVQVLRADLADAARVAATAGELEAHVRRGAALARQLLLFSRRQVTKREPLDLNRVVSEGTELLQRLVRENIRTRVDLAPGGLLVDADRGQLEQVLVNLVVNASDAMAEGGLLTLRTGHDEGESVWFEVEDTGTGVPSELRERIFEPFFTTKRSGQGTGLGLAVVDGIVGQHGGRVEVESRLGEGSRFRVLLPLGSRRRSGRERPIEVNGHMIGGSGERVLLVEDETGAREGLREVLEILGYAVIAVDSGEAAEALPERPGFDVLLTDLLLPGIHGGELAQRLARRWPGLAVIIMSGYTEDEAIRRGVSEGNVRFLQKPFDMDVLGRELRAVLEPAAASDA